jgi:hypothetical protein
MGSKHRHGIIVGAIGSFVWAYAAVQRGTIDLVVIEVLLGLLGLRAWRNWDVESSRRVS